MTTLELKNSLIRRIEEINDKSFLQAIKTILDTKVGVERLLLTPEQKDEILQSKKDFSSGKSIANDDLQQEIDKWLQEK